MRKVHALFVGLVVAVGCVGPGATPTRPAPQRDVLTRSEILSSTAERSNLFEAVQSLRPLFLSTPRAVFGRGSTASSPLAVYVNRMRQSGVESLRSIAAANVDEVRFLEPTAAQNQFGPAASGGAIVVTLTSPAKEPPYGSTS